jgi:anti-sigma regulatory factor (Ser/Thr protein kinase)
METDQAARSWIGRLDLSSILAVREARRYVRAGLLSSFPDDRLDDLVLVVSEVVTNAVIHGAPPGTLGIFLSDALVRIEVSDSTSAAPVQGVAHHESHRGRGVALMDSLSDRWGVVVGPGEGKIVWFEVDRRW